MTPAPRGLESDVFAALREAVGVPEPTPPSRPSVRGRLALKPIAKRVIRKAMGWYVREEASRAVAESTGSLRNAVVELGRVMDQYADLAALPVNFEFLKEEVTSLHATTANLELLKAEVRELKQIMEGIGFAIAPGAGLDGIAPRFAELRQQVNAVARQQRAWQPDASPPEGDRLAAMPASTGGFDYVGLEQRFRGDSAEILALAKERYFDLLQGHEPVLDVGCGRGELVGALVEAGIDAVGVDLDAGMVEQAQASGVNAHHGDAIAFLREQPRGTYGAIVSIQVVEHLPFEVLMQLVNAAATQLKPGGLLIMETPNPMSLFVLGNTFLLDPTHVRPVHPSLLVFLCERAGFVDVELRFESPLTSHYLPAIEADEDAPAWTSTYNEAIHRLNGLLFGPQDYAVVATAPGG